MLKKLKRLAAAITAAAVMSVPAIGTGAEEQAVTYDLSEGSVTISTDGTYIITQSDSTATTNNITVEAGVNADITLSGINIDVSGQSGVSAFKIADNSTGNVTVILAANTENTLKSGASSAGLQKNGSGEGIGTLTITGEGSLTTNGGYGGAGIGGGDAETQWSGNGTNITIRGGTVTANGGDYGAGIGGGDQGSGSNITISGGNVTANGGDLGAGIGGGDWGNGSNITISGGNVTANGGDLGAGIGGGRAASRWSGNGTNITISGGTVTANGGQDGAGIGGGSEGSGSNITISGGTVTANGSNGGAGIGNGYEPYDGNNSGIVINGGSVKVSSITNAQPTDGSENNVNVYLLTLSNGNDETVVIDDKVYAPVNHKAADPEDGNLYAYLTGESHIVNIGNSRYTYEYDINNGFVLTYDMEITFTDENNEVIGTVYAYSDEDISALAPAVPEKEDIAGKWDTDLSTITESCTVKAVYQIKVTFVDENNEVIDTVYAYADEDISALAPEIPEKEGYTGAWDTDLGAITESCTVKAVYTEIPDESSEESSDVSSDESSETSDESSDVTSDNDTESGISDECAGSSDTESVSDSNSDSADSSKADPSASGSSDKNPSTGAAAGAAAVLLISAGVAVLKKRG